ncbi:MAG: septum formation family protein, partial [Nocardioides sp.]
LARDDSLATLTGPLGVRLEGVLDRADLRDRFAICGTAQPGTSGFRRVICHASHTWRTLRTIGFAAGRYPGVDAVQAAGPTPCRDAAHAVAADPLSFEWTYEWPTAAQWASGQHYGYCWAPSST